MNYWLIVLAVLLALMPMVLNVFFSIALSVAAELWVLSVILVLQMIVKSDNKVIVNVPKEAVKVNVETLGSSEKLNTVTDNTVVPMDLDIKNTWGNVEVGEISLEGEKL